MAPKYDRLTRPQVIEALREHARGHGFVSVATLAQHDRILSLSIPLHFVGLDAARHAARVPEPPSPRGGAKRGPKPGTVGTPRPRIWSRQKVIAELRRLDRAGESTRLDDLIESGRVALVGAARDYAGGLTKARADAGIRVGEPAPTAGLTRDDVVRQIRMRARRGMSLATTHVPQTLYRAARYKFGSWPKALSSLGIDPRAVRAWKRVYTKEEIIRRLRRAARQGSELRYHEVRRMIDLKAIRREFGTLAKAITAAGLDAHLMRRAQRGQVWSRERLVAELRERAEHRLTQVQYKAARLLFGGTEEARTVAGVPLQEI